jgi:hypothetical protein
VTKAKGVLMTKQAPVLTRHDLEAKIIKRCWESDEFQQQFTADPVGTAVKYLEVPAATLPKIFVHQEALGSWHIVLAAKPASNGELSDEDLEKVAGDTNPTPVVVTLVASGAVIGSTASATIGWSWCYEAKRIYELTS